MRAGKDEQATAQVIARALESESATCVYAGSYASARATYDRYRRAALPHLKRANRETMLLELKNGSTIRVAHTVEEPQPIVMGWF